jgi:nucleoside-diphosphate kinase
MVAIIDSAGVQSGRVEPNLEVLNEQGFLVMNQKKMMLTSEQAKTFVSGEEYDFTSGPVVALLLKRADCYKHYEKIREDVDNTYASIDTWTTLRDKAQLFPTKAQLQRTLVLVKPDYSQEDYTRILQTIDEHDFVLIHKLVRIVSEYVATTMFNGDPEHVKYVSSDVSVVLVIEKVGAVDEWQLLCGPSDPALASAVAPDSLYANVNAQDKVRNVLYASESAEKANRDIVALFPAPFQSERTLFIIKPDIIANGYDYDAMEVIKANGFQILAEEEVYLSSQRASQMTYEGVASTPAQTRYMSSGLCKVFVLGKPRAANALWKLVGPVDPAEARQTKPSSLIARFGADAVKNGFHASENADVAKAEIDFFFPQMQVEQVPTLNEVEDTLNAKPAPRPFVDNSQSLQDVLMKGLVNLCKVKPSGDEAITHLANWLLRNNPNKPSVDLPGELTEEPSVLDQISGREGKASEVIWAVGPPGSRTEDGVKYIATLGYTTINVATLLATNEASGSEYGELIKTCKRNGTTTPAHVAVNLIKEAMLNSAGSHAFVITGFPSTMDEALHFQNVIGEVNQMLYFDCADATKAERLKEAQSDDTFAETKAFNLDVKPILEHLRPFGKVVNISTDGVPGDQNHFRTKLGRILPKH